MTRTEIHELVRELKKYAIKVKVRNYSVKLSGGNSTARKHYEKLVDSDEEIQAMLILELSKNNPDIRYDIEERASICWAEGGEYNLLEATKAVMKWYRDWEEWLLRNDTGDKQFSECGEVAVWIQTQPSRAKGTA